MLYKIKTWALGNYPSIKISEEEFERIRHSSKVLQAALSIEEKYELVLSNFLELEKDRMSISLENMIRSNDDYSDFFDVRSLFNRRIVNLLTSTRMYIDQISQHARICNPSLVDIIKTKLSEEYDSIFEYRFMEALRNYVQHRGLAVHLTTNAKKVVCDNEDRLVEFQTKIFATKTSIENDKAFKKATSLEMPDKVDLFVASRKYVAALSRVHSFIRDSIDDVVDQARTEVKSAIENYASLNGGEQLGIYVICYESDEDYPESIVEKNAITLSWEDVRKSLVSRNRNLLNLDKRYISTKCL